MIHNQLTDSAELLNGIGRAAGLSEGDGVIRLGETLDPTIDPWSQPEWAYLRNERLGGGRGFSAAVAAEFSIIALGNAIGSGNIVVVEAVSAQGGAGNPVLQLEVVADSIIAGTLSAAAFFISARDRRFGATTGRTFLKTGTDVASTFGVQIEHQTSATAFTPFTNLPVILKPGDDLIVIEQTVNLALDVNFKWRERKAFKNELPA